METEVDFRAIGRQICYGLKAISIFAIVVAGLLGLGWVIVKYLLSLGIGLVIVLLAWLVGFVHECDDPPPDFEGL